MDFFKDFPNQNPRRIIEELLLSQGILLYLAKYRDEHIILRADPTGHSLFKDVFKLMTDQLIQKKAMHFLKTDKEKINMIESVKILKGDSVLPLVIRNKEDQHYIYYVANKEAIDIMFICILNPATELPAGIDTRGMILLSDITKDIDSRFAEGYFERMGMGGMFK